MNGQWAILSGADQLADRSFIPHDQSAFHRAILLNLQTYGVNPRTEATLEDMRDTFIAAEEGRC